MRPDFSHCELYLSVASRICPELYLSAVIRKYAATGQKRDDRRHCTQRLGTCALSEMPRYTLTWESSGPSRGRVTLSPGMTERRLRPNICVETIRWLLAAAHEFHAQ